MKSGYIINILLIFFYFFKNQKKIFRIIILKITNIKQSSSGWGRSLFKCLLKALSCLVSLRLSEVFLVDLFYFLFLNVVHLALLALSVS